MSSFFEYIQNLPASLYGAMSPSLWQRLRGSNSAPKAIAARTEEEQAKDKEAVQKAIAEAVSAALNGEDFTKAVAGHLATQLQPSLKAALDLSTVETKLLESNAELSKRVDESTALSNTKLSNLSTLLDANNTTTAGKISSIEAAVALITESLVELGYTVKALQQSVASPDASLLASHGEKLDTISTGLNTLREQGPAPITGALSDQATKLDTIVAELAIIKSNAESAAALKSQLTTLKTDLEISDGKQFSGIATQIDKVLKAIEAQNTTLAEIKAADVGSQVLAGVKASNDSHNSHAAVLAELKSSHEAQSATLSELKAANNRPEILEGVKASNEAHASHAKALSELQSASIQPDILAAVQSSNETLASHSATLSELKSIIATPAPAAEAVDLSPISSKLEEHSTHLSEIKSAVTHPAPAAETVDLAPLSAKLDEHSAHLADIKSTLATPAPEAKKVDLSPLSSKLDEHSTHLTELKSIVSTPAPVPAPVDLSPLSAKLDEHSAHLTEIKSAVNTPAPAAEKIDLSPLSAKLDDIKSAVSSPAPAPEKVDLSPISAKLDEHSARLTDIKSAISTRAPSPEKVDLSSLETSVKSIHTALEAQSTTLSEIKDNPTGNTVDLKILSLVEGLKTDDAEILGEVKEVKTLMQKDEKDQSAEILVEVKEVKALMQKDEKDQSAEILVEVKEVKALVQKVAEVSIKEVEVGENDKGVPVKNGVKSEEAEVAPAEA